jgi:putative spermidine/putrescine transport system ATP-binding protein
VDGLLPEKRDFGMVFQNYALFPHLSVKRNIAFGLKIRKVAKTEIDRRVDEVLSLVQLTEHKSKHPAQLSGGQQQRVAIARAVVLEPQVVLMDEPLSNLDAKLRQEMRTEIKRLHNTLGLTTVYVTHDQEEALSLADRLVVLNSGKVQQIGTPEDVFLRPVNAFVADFMGYRNRLPMKLESSGTAGKYVLSHSDLKITATSISPGVQPGSVLVAIRPDEFETENVTHNPISGVVRSVEYQGKDFALEVEIASDVYLHVRTFRKYGLGDSITVGVNPDRVLVFPPKEDRK